MFTRDLLIVHRFLELVRMTLKEMHPFNLLLEETESTTGTRTPFVIFRQPDTGIVQDVDHTLLIDAVLTERHHNVQIRMAFGHTCSVWFVRSNSDVTEDLVTLL